MATDDYDYTSQTAIGMAGGRSNMKFPQKLWTLVTNDTSGALGWNPLGDGILIDHNRFVQYYLNTGVFKTSRMSSFVRQLNLYGFRKTNGPSGNRQGESSPSAEENASRPTGNPYPPGIREYKHKYFNRHHPQWLNQVFRVSFAKSAAVGRKPVGSNSGMAGTAGGTTVRRVAAKRPGNMYEFMHGAAKVAFPGMPHQTSHFTPNAHNCYWDPNLNQMTTAGYHGAGMGQPQSHMMHKPHDQTTWPPMMQWNEPLPYHYHSGGDQHGYGTSYAYGASNVSGYPVNAGQSQMHDSNYYVQQTQTGGLYNSSGQNAYYYPPGSSGQTMHTVEHPIPTVQAVPVNASPGVNAGTTEPLDDSMVVKQEPVDNVLVNEEHADSGETSANTTQESQSDAETAEDEQTGDEISEEDEGPNADKRIIVTRSTMNQSNTQQCSTEELMNNLNEDQVVTETGTNQAVANDISDASKLPDFSGPTGFATNAPSTDVTAPMSNKLMYSALEVPNPSGSTHAHSHGIGCCPQNQPYYYHQHNHHNHFSNMWAQHQASHIYPQGHGGYFGQNMPIYQSVLQNYPPLPQAHDCGSTLPTASNYEELGSVDSAFKSYYPNCIDTPNDELVGQKEELQHHEAGSNVDVIIQSSYEPQIDQPEPESITISHEMMNAAIAETTDTTDDNEDVGCGDTDKFDQKIEITIDDDVVSVVELDDEDDCEETESVDSQIRQMQSEKVTTLMAEKEVEPESEMSVEAVPSSKVEIIDKPKGSGTKLEKALNKIEWQKQAKLKTRAKK